jgi:hypothetical protein
MKTILGLGLLLAGSAAFACPDLSGTYTAQESMVSMQVAQNACETISFTATDANGVQQYSQTFLTDGKPQSPAGGTNKYIYTYEGDAFITYILEQSDSSSDSRYRLVYEKEGSNLAYFASSRVKPDGSIDTVWHDGEKRYWIGH